MFRERRQWGRFETGNIFRLCLLVLAFQRKTLNWMCTPWQLWLPHNHSFDPQGDPRFDHRIWFYTFQASGVPGYSKVQLLQNIISILSSKSGPITGQEQSVACIEKNPCATINPSQPYMKVKPFLCFWLWYSILLWLTKIYENSELEFSNYVKSYNWLAENTSR